MTTIQIDAGTLTASESDRTITGLLVPYGEACASNLGSFTVDTGAFTVPADLSGMSLNVEHAREQVIGQPTQVRDTAEGIVATFSVARTPEGDEALEDVKAGRRKHLSAEVAGVRITDGKAVAGRLFAAALVARPAFPSATLLASAVDTVTEADADPDAEETQVVSEVVVTPEATTVVTEIPTATAAETQEEEDAMADATAPATLTATAAVEDTPTKSTLFAAVTQAAKFGDNSGLQKLAEHDAKTGLFALSDVKYNGTGGLANAVAQPQYVGEIWQGRTFARKVIPLISAAPLTSFEVKGWKWGVKPEVAEWAGNKANVPSNTPTTIAYSLTAQRFAGGHDIAREFVDFGVSEVLDGYSRAMADSYARKSDAYALTQLLAGATTSTVGALPSGVGDAIGKIVRGALRVVSSDALPSFALVAPDLYEELAFTRQEDVLAFLSLSLGLEEGQMASFRIVPHTGLAAGTALVGAREAATAYELPGVPIRVSALDLAKGGYDEAIFGYIATGVEYPTGLQLVTPNA